MVFGWVDGCCPKQRMDGEGDLSPKLKTLPMAGIEVVEIGLLGRWKQVVGPPPPSHDQEAEKKLHGRIRPWLKAHEPNEDGAKMGKQ